MTNPETPKETLGFQAEVRELLKLMIHSLYSHREIFLRELISNASDANDKLRFESLSKPELLAGDTELAVWIEADKDKGTLSIRDNGIGMSREEAISHLGTIARSGTAEFFKKLSGDQQKDSQLIGQFGVGFYSAFIVAERVEVLTRRAGLPAGEGVRWESSADGEFTVETVERAERGTTVVLHLKEDAKEFLDAWRLRSLVRRYSDHIAFPVRMPKEGEATLEYEAVNRGTALWARPKAEIKDEEYVEFYRYLTHDHGRAARLVAQPRRRQARIHQPHLHPCGCALRPVAARRGARPQAVRAARVHHGRRRAVPAAVPAIREGRARFRRPAAERVARAAAGRQRGRGHARRAHAARARDAGQARQGRCREVPGLLARVRRRAEGRPGRRSRQSRQAAAAAAVCLHH